MKLEKSIMRAQRPNRKEMGTLSIAGNAAINSSADIPGRRQSNRDFVGQQLKGTLSKRAGTELNVLENSYEDLKKLPSKLRKVPPQEMTKSQAQQMLSQEYKLLHSPTATKSIVPRMKGGPSPKPKQSVSTEQYRARSQGRKLFVQEFYNIKKSKKRDLMGIALHNHPDSGISGVFQEYKAAGVSGYQLSPDPSQDSFLLNAEVPAPAQIPMRKLNKQFTTALKHERKTSLPIQQMKSNVQLQGSNAQNLKTIVVLPQTQIRLGTIALGAQEGKGSMQPLGHSEQLLLPSINKESMTGRVTELRGVIDTSHSLEPMIKGSHQQISHAQLMKHVGHPSAADKDNFALDAMQSYVNNSHSLDHIGKVSPERSPRNNGGLDAISREKRYQRLQVDMQRVDDDHFYLYKSLQKETFGQPVGYSEARYGTGVATFDKTRRSQQTLVANLKQRSQKKGTFDRRGTSTNAESEDDRSGRKLRHPDLVHKLQGSQLSYAEQKLEHFANRAPVFSKQAMNQEEMTLNERVKHREPKNVELTRTLQRLKDRQSLFDKSKKSKVKITSKIVTLSHDAQAEQAFGGETSDAIVQRICGQYQADKLTEGNSESGSNVSDLDREESNIQDPVAFQEKLDKKLDQMVDPESIQLFSVDQSKQLYSVITKQQKKLADERERKDQHYSRSLKTLPPPSVLQEKQITPKRKKTNLSPAKNNGLSALDKCGKSMSTASIEHTSNDPAKQQLPADSHNQSLKGAGRSKKVKDTSRPDYFAGKGRISIDGLKKKFEDDLMNNLKLADKMGVFNVLRDMYFDAHQKMQWLEKRRHENKQLNFADDDEPAEFPGYEERLDQIEDEIRKVARNKVEQEAKCSVELIGEERAGFHLNEGSKIDLSAIYSMFKQDGLKNFSAEQLRNLLSQGEVIAFMTQIEMQKVKSDDGGAASQEAELVEYIKYLIGESNNVGFELDRNDYSQKHELNKQSLKLAWDGYASQEENAMKTVANDIIERVDYRTVIKHESEPISIIRYEDNPKYYYFQVCQKDSDLAIPLLAKVVNRQLSLMNYQLSVGHIKAFVRTFEFNHEFVNRFLFKNCGMTDQHTEILLNHCSQLKQVMSLVLKQEEFGIRAMQAIKPLLVRPKPSDLQVLRIIDCRIPQQVTRELISTLLETNYLRVLGLVNTKMSDSSMQELAQLVGESRHLRELDISWNLLKPQSYINLINSLGENRLLLSLNLSFNKIVESKETFPEPTQGSPCAAQAAIVKGGAQPAYIDRMLSSQGSQRSKKLQEDLTPQWYSREATFTDQSTQALESICSLLKRNKKLQHVNLQSTGLSEMMMVKIANALARAKSLTSIHLCSNPGTTVRVKEYMQRRVRCMPQRNRVKFPISEILNRLQNTVTKDILKRQLTCLRGVKGEKPVARETIKIKQNKERKRIFSLVNDFGGDTQEESVMILSRILGHKMDMPGSGQWKLIRDKQEECWVCDQQIYGLAFWDAERIASKAHMSTKIIDQEPYMREAMSRLHATVNIDEEDSVARANPNVPIIMGDFTNWRPKPCIDIVNYSETLSPQFDKEAIIQRMHFDKVLTYRKNDPISFEEDEEEIYRRYTCQFYEEGHAPESWKNVLQKTLLYKKPHLINAADTREDFYHTLFMHPAMFRVGRHDFVIRAPLNRYDRQTGLFVHDDSNLLGQPDYQYFSNVSDIRPEDIHPFIKSTVKNAATRFFNKEKSVFKPWKELTTQQLAQSFEIDIENNKICKLLAKNQDDLTSTIQILRENYSYLRDCYLENQYHSVYPFINKIQLSSFAEKAKLLDDNLNMANCDLLFSYFEKSQRPGIKQKTGLIRTEFLEYLVRLADFKYVQTKYCKTYYEAVKKVLDEFLKPNYKPMPWQRFRVEELWTLEVNDVFETNIDGINKLHQVYFTPTQRFMSDKDATNLLTKDGTLDLTYTQAKYCLSYSKMPTKDEISQFEQYHKLHPVELMEMIGRAAKIRFTNTEYDDEPLEKKIEMVLDMLFPIINFKRRDVASGQDSESMSDDDY